VCASVVRLTFVTLVVVTMVTLCYRGDRDWSRSS